MRPRVRGSPLDTFNLSHYNSSNEQLRLSHFKMNRRPIRCRRVPPNLSEDWWLRSNMWIRCFSTCHITCTLRERKIAPYGKNEGKFRVYRSSMFSWLAYILNRMLNPLITCVHTRAHMRTPMRHMAHAHVATWWYIIHPTTSAITSAWDRK